jgi:hypothetical protein
MRKSFRKGAVVFGAVVAVCAFVMPSMASALSWAPVGTAHTLGANGLGFTAHTSMGPAGAQCANASFTADVRSAAVITITTAAFSNCTGTGVAANCTATVTASGFHWTATGITTSNVQIHGINILNTFSGGSCLLPGQTARVTGTLSNGTWRGNGAGQHSITLADGTGLVAHIPALGSTPFVATVSDTLVVDNQGTITLS